MPAHAPPPRPASARASWGAGNGHGKSLEQQDQPSHSRSQHDLTMPHDHEGGNDDDDDNDVAVDHEPPSVEPAVVVEGIAAPLLGGSSGLAAHRQIASAPPTRSASLDSFNIHSSISTSSTTPPQHSLKTHSAHGTPPFNASSTFDSPSLSTFSSYSSRPTAASARLRNPGAPILHPLVTTGAAGALGGSPMSSPRTHGDLSHRVLHSNGAGSGAGGGGGPSSAGASSPGGMGAASDRDQRERQQSSTARSSFTSALSPTLAASADDGHSHPGAAFHRRRMSNPTRRRSSLVQEPLSAGPSRSNSVSRQGSIDLPAQLPHTPSATAGPSSALGWLGHRLTLPPAEHKKSKSDDEREVDENDIDIDLGPSHHHHLPHHLNPGHRSSLSSSSLPSLSKSRRHHHPHHPRVMRASLDVHSTGDESQDEHSYPPGQSVPTLVAPIPTTTSTSPSQSQLLPLPQDPNHILPLSTPPLPNRESLDSGKGATSFDHGSTPRTSMSLSEGTGWGSTEARSYSESSGGEDEDSPTSTSAWWFRAHPRPPPSMRPIIRQAPNASRLLSMGTRRWGWLLAPIRQFTGTHEYQAVGGSGTRKHSGYDREKFYPTTTQRRRRTVCGSRWLALGVNYIQAEPWMVTLGLVAFAIFGIVLGFSIKYILDPDKAALPWREYATAEYPTIFSIQDADWDNSALGGSLPPLSILKPVTSNHSLWPYPGYEYAPHSENLHGGPRVDDVEPTTLFIAIFTYDKGAHRRNLIRQSYAKHPRSRRPGSEGVRLRFVMGTPRPGYKEAVDKEIESESICARGLVPWLTLQCTTTLSCSTWSRT